MKKFESGDNRKLHNIYRRDQNDRQTEYWKKNQNTVVKRDASRLSAVKDLIRNRELKTQGDYFKAAVIFHHNDGIKNYEKANSLIQKAKKIAPSDLDIVWLAAVSHDRLLVAKGKKQKFGSQFEYADIGGGKFRYQMAPYDRRTSDNTRKLNELPSLKKLKKMEGEIIDTN